MTCREKLKIEHPEMVGEQFMGGCRCCPHYYGYLPKTVDGCGEISCKECWDREIPEEKEGYDKVSEFATIDAFIPNAAREAVGLPKITDEFNEISNEQIVTPEETRHILDSGARREFGTGAVRDIQEGKGRCDLLPLDVVSVICDEGESDHAIIDRIYKFQNDGGVGHLFGALDSFAVRYFEAATMGGACCTMALEVSIHFEEGAKKYGENNWQKGIPVHCYIDSAVRHYLKFMRGDKDEPHDRAFCWNIMCAIWTCKHKPELNDYAKRDTSAVKEMMD